ncbi:hypothetical protein [Pendulispora albinea]|uniref:thiazole synthase n=1 Tax=Pendulispora albinea TaxID=2741071 RepID=A0ABZ2LLQ6_9BACT
MLTFNRAHRRIVLSPDGTPLAWRMASPVGSARGIEDERAMQRAIDRANVPVIVERRIHAMTHPVQAMQTGADAVLVDPAVVRASDPVPRAAGGEVRVEP